MATLGYVMLHAILRTWSPLEILDISERCRAQIQYTTSGPDP